MQCVQDEFEVKRATSLVCKEYLDSKRDKVSWRAVLGFAMQQGEKIRRIDDGRRGGMNEATTLFEKFVLCNAAQPVLDAKALAMAASSEGKKLQYLHQTIECVSEDMRTPSHCSM